MTDRSEMPRAFRILVQTDGKNFFSYRRSVKALSPKGAAVTGARELGLFVGTRVLVLDTSEDAHLFHLKPTGLTIEEA